MTSNEEIRRAYRRLARRWQPDAHPANSAEAERRFKEVSAADDVLGDPHTHCHYDEARRPGSGRSRRVRIRWGKPGGFGGLGGFLDRVFHGRQAWLPQPVREAELEAEVSISLEEALAGTRTKVTVPTEEPCPARRAAGANPARTARACPTCRGRASMPGEGLFLVRRACATCDRHGTSPETPCAACGGDGARKVSRQLAVRVPPGIHDGQRVRVVGRGTPGLGGSGLGDLLVTVRVLPHRRFGRRGPHLTFTIPVSYPQAVLGADIELPAPQAAAVTVRIPPGTQPGQVLRVPEAAHRPRAGQATCSSPSRSRCPRNRPRRSGSRPRRWRACRTHPLETSRGSHYDRRA